MRKDDIRIERVTPQTARKWLDTSIGNRPISSTQVALFAQYMTAGEWNRLAQPIYFDEDGHLMDGHTRLNAVVKSGATIEMMVVRNYPRKDWNKLNTGKVWSAGNFASANGVKAGNVAMAAVKIREALKRGLRIGSVGNAAVGKVSGHIWTNDDYMRLYLADADWPEDVDFAISMWRQWYGISASMCAGVIHHLVHDCRWRREFVCDFFRQVYTLDGLTANTRALRKRIDMERSNGAVITPNFVCLLVNRAFEGYAANMPKSALKIFDLRAVAKFPRNRS